MLECAGLVLLASPSAFLTWRMVDQIRGIDLDVVSETDTYKVIRVCRMCTRSRSAVMLRLKMDLLISDDISRRNKS